MANQPGKGDDELARALVELVDGHAAGPENGGVHDGDEVVEEVGRLVEQLVGIAAHALLEALGARARHAVPRLGAAPVQVVDRVGPVVLHVPAEAGEAHAHVRPRHLCSFIANSERERKKRERVNPEFS